MYHKNAHHTVNNLLWISVFVCPTGCRLIAYCIVLCFYCPQGQTLERPVADPSPIQQIFQLAKCSLYAANTVWICSFTFTAASWDILNNKIFHLRIIHRLFARALYLSIINLNCKIHLSSSIICLALFENHESSGMKDVGADLFSTQFSIILEKGTLRRHWYISWW